MAEKTFQVFILLLPKNITALYGIAGAELGEHEGLETVGSRSGYCFQCVSCQLVSANPASQISGDLCSA